jgi:hypothetical protein
MSSESDDDLFCLEPTISNVRYHIGRAIYELQILREDQTGEAKAQMDKLFWALNKSLTKLRVVERGDSSKESKQ